MRITVITADIMNSRSAPSEVERLPERLGALHHPDLVVRYAMSRGDEIQGVLSGWLTAPEVLRLLRWQCRPLKLRIGIGLGVHRGKLTKNPWDLNGPAFFRARSALDVLARSRQATTWIETGGAKELDNLLNATLLLLDTIEAGWTDAQWQAIIAYESEKTYAAAAAKLGIAPQNVHKRCQAARWHAVRDAEDALRCVGSLLPEQG